MLLLRVWSDFLNAINHYATVIIRTAGKKTAEGAKRRLSVASRRLSTTSGRSGRSSISSGRRSTVNGRKSGRQTVQSSGRQTLTRKDRQSKVGEKDIFALAGDKAPGQEHDSQTSLKKRKSKPAGRGHKQGRVSGHYPGTRRRSSVKRITVLI